MEKILLGITGSVAAKLTPRLAELLQGGSNQVQIVATPSSFYFWKEGDVNIPIYKEEDEWPRGGYNPNNPIVHIALREWADTLVIAPLTANTLAKIANGLADNLLTSVVRAWDQNKRIVIAPAMNTKMWEHPITKSHLNQLSSFFNLTVVQPIAKKLACGDEGIGAMAEIDNIVKATRSA